MSAQALKFGHMLTPEAGQTQWMDEHEEEACQLLRKPLGQCDHGIVYHVMTQLFYVISRIVSMTNQSYF